MPVKTCFSNVYSTRFDFGLPLEDVFPPNDIHPRLKFLFSKTFEAYVESGLNIQNILKYDKGPLKERLALKDQLVLALNYHSNVEVSSGAYFWILRHFLGLLPLPLFPTYTKGVQFAWDYLADECKYMLKYRDHQKMHDLDYDIAETLNMLPLENFILLNVLIHFFRKISLTEVGRRLKFHRPSLISLSTYYCSSLFVRPFRPGYYRKNEYRPLLVYLILRWQNIVQHCHSVGHPTYFLNWDVDDFKCSGFSKLNNAFTQTKTLCNAFFEPEIITVFKNIPYLSGFCKKYFNDMACQTETDLSMVKIEFLKEPDKFEEDNNVYKLAYIEELEEEAEETPKSEELLGNGDTFYQTAPEFTINNSSEEDDWKTILAKTRQTVKKVEESYIYDDYETFKKEDFNQVGKNRLLGSFISKISKLHSSKQIPKSSTPKNSSPESENSYIKYPDVYTDNSEDSLNEYETNEDKNRDLDELKVTDQSVTVRDGVEPKVPVAQKLFQNNSPASVEGEDSKQHLHGDKLQKTNKKRTRTNVLKRLRMSLDLLRTMTPKKSTFKKIESKVRYRRIKSEKFHTI